MIVTSSRAAAIIRGSGTVPGGQHDIMKRIILAPSNTSAASTSNSSLLLIFVFMLISRSKGISLSSIKCVLLELFEIGM